MLFFWIDVMVWLHRHDFDQASENSSSIQIKSVGHCVLLTESNCDLIPKKSDDFWLSDATSDTERFVSAENMTEFVRLCERLLRVCDQSVLDNGLYNFLQIGLWVRGFHPWGWGIRFRFVFVNYTIIISGFSVNGVPVHFYTENPQNITNTCNWW